MQVHPLLLLGGRAILGRITETDKDTNCWHRQARMRALKAAIWAQVQMQVYVGGTKFGSQGLCAEIFQM